MNKLLSSSGIRQFGRQSFGAITSKTNESFACILSRSFGVYNSKLKGKDRFKVYKEPEFDVPFASRPIDEAASLIDTTLTTEQREYVEKLKKQIKGGSSRSKRCK